MRTKVFFIAILAAFFMLAIYSCQKNSNPVGTSSDSTDLLATSVVPDVQAVPSDIDEASTTNQMMMRVPSGNLTYIRLGRILAQLKLDSLQKTQVKVYLVDYQDCYTTAMTTLRASEQIIIDTANARRKVILDEFKNKTISADSALKSLRTLNKATRDSLNNNPALTTAKADVKACLDSLFANIRSILTTAQQTTWDAWIAKLNTTHSDGDDDYRLYRGFGYYMGHHYGWGH